ncbi:uroporphyrinogen-III synthase [Rhodoblastus sp.]|uniref:uroporphyrinogen-III synthase n=1 Tax=Rhodoblastus sp. TaxID=1962975 RepID=UPI00260B7B74|nr:uroporphyrinogen-III synthase [Rhodoblastus sp.]
MRVLVTRPSDQAAGTAKRLAALGHEALIAPVLEIFPTGAPVPDGPFDLVLATSAQAFAGGTAPPAIRGVAVACVGEKTARAARDAGFEVEFVAPRAEALVEWLIAEKKSGAALYLAGRERKPVLEQRLAGAGWRLELVETYDARPVASWPEEIVAALRHGRIDAVLHYSPRSAGAALALMGAAAARLSHFCLSSDVADRCRAIAPEATIFIASQPDEEALISLLGSAESRHGDRTA